MGIKQDGRLLFYFGFFINCIAFAHAKLKRLKKGAYVYETKL